MKAYSMLTDIPLVHTQRLQYASKAATAGSEQCLVLVLVL